MMEQTHRYILRKKLQGSEGPVNTLLFSKDGTLLLSGGDDECVRVWNTDDYICQQVLHKPKWGQVTTLTWLMSKSVINDVNTSICVGTGRGSIGIFPLSKDGTLFVLKDAAILPAFAFNDAVEAQAYDSIKSRLAVASHSGQIKLFSVDKCVSLMLLWTANISNAIPSALMFFGGTNESLLVHGVETGEMSCLDAHTSTLIWARTLAGGIGNAALSPDETTLLVDNLTTGTFDIYRFPSSVPSSSFALTSTRKFAKQCVFSERGKVAVCGSDCGKVHVVDVATGQCLQSLRTEKEFDLIQSVAATPADSTRLLIAGGLSDDTSSDIYLWEKQLDQEAKNVGNTSIPDTPRGRASILTRQSTINLVFALIIMLVSYPNWSPLLWNCTKSAKIFLVWVTELFVRFNETGV